MPFFLKVQPSCVPAQDLHPLKFHLLVVLLRCNCFAIQLLRKGGKVILCVWLNLLAPYS